MCRGGAAAAPQNGCAHGTAVRLNGGKISRGHGIFRDTRRGKTTILIAHRISTIEQMDRVLFIDQGRLSGFDTHQALYASTPAYRKMVDLQRLEEEGGKE